MPWMEPFVHALLIHTARAKFNFCYFFENMVFDAPYRLPPALFPIA